MADRDFLTGSLRVSGAWLAAFVVLPLASGCGGSGAPSRTTLVPRLPNSYLEDALMRLRQRELKAVVATLPRVERASWNENAYVVVAQTPRAGVRVSVGAAVRLRLGVSLNGGGPWPPPRAESVVPDVRMWSVGAAFGVMTNPMLGLLVTIMDADSVDAEQRPFSQGILVVRTEPGPGSRVRAGTNVVLVVKRFGR